MRPELISGTRNKNVRGQGSQVPHDYAMCSLPKHVIGAALEENEER